MWRFQKRRPLKNRTCRVLFAGPHFQAALPLTRARLMRMQQQHHHHHFDMPNVELVRAPTTAELMEKARSAHVAIPFMERFDATFLQAARQLRMIIQFGVGLEGVDVKEATRRGIVVSNIPADQTGNAQATAEHALFLAMALLRRAFDELPRRFQNGELGGLPAPQALYQKRVTVVGYGSVGSVLCRYLSVMGAASVTAVRRNWDKKKIIIENDTTATVIKKSTNLSQVLPSTDVLILACTLTRDTYHLLNHQTLPLLPRGALVVNVGRGPLIEYEAMVSGLQSGAIGGFASDVGIGGSAIHNKPSEPWDPHDAICKFSNVLFTPHVGGYTHYSYGQMADKVLQAIYNIAVHGKPPDVWVNRPNDVDDDKVDDKVDNEDQM